jgi:hypothetical protein
MSLSKIEKLTPEQEALIPVYREKWRKIALSTERLDRAKAESVIKAAYIAIGKPEPEVQFYSSPCVVWKSFSCYWQHYLGNRLRMMAGLPLREIPNTQLEKYELGKRLFNQIMVRPLGYTLEDYLVEDLKKQLKSNLGSRLNSKLEINLLPQSLLKQLGQQSQSILEPYYHEVTCGGGADIHLLINGSLILFLEAKFCSSIRPEVWARDASLLDFCFSVLNCPYDLEKWELLQALIINCGWIYPFEKTCIVCERPIKLSFDSQDRLHAEGKLAIQFADGWGFYSYHGVTLPEKYGAVHPREWQAQWYLQEPIPEFRQLLLEVLPPHQWQAQWILKEDNAELRRVLIQEIGYTRICQELQATELDSWAEYTLLRIDKMIDMLDGQPNYLLKMTCPSTGFIHAMRVPPNMRSAREAIRWVNWGIDPEEFSVQT